MEDTHIAVLPPAPAVIFLIVTFQSSSGSSGSSIRGDRLIGDQLTKLNCGFPKVANGDVHHQPNEELHLRVMELSAR